MAGDSAHICQAYSIIGVVCTHNLRPGMNSAANFTFIKIFNDLKLVSFMPYTYNIEGCKMGLDMT